MAYIPFPIVTGQTSGGGGSSVHNDLAGRSAADAHPTSAITGLAAALAAAGNVDSVNGQTGTVSLDLDDLTDVDTTTDPPDADDVLAWDGVTWTPATLTALGAPGLSNANPADLGTAAPGVATEASRADHVHDLPTAADVGAAASAHVHSGADITSGTVGTARLGSGTADATTFLRGDGTWAVSGEVPRVSGRYYLWGQSGSNFSPAKDRLYLVPFPTFGSVTLAALAMQLTVAGGAGSVFRMGLYAYNEALGVPWGAPLVDAGTVTADATTAVKELPFSVSTSARMVVLASVWQGGTVGSGAVSGVNATSQSYAMPYVSSPTPLVGTYDFPALGWIIPSVTGALPTISAAPATNGEFFPRLIVKVG